MIALLLEAANSELTLALSRAHRWTWKQCHTPKMQGILPDIYNVPEPNTWG